MRRKNLLKDKKRIEAVFRKLESKKQMKNPLQSEGILFFFNHCLTFFYTLWLLPIRTKVTSSTLRSEIQPVVSL